METVSVECASCEQRWTTNLHSIYEQQVVESRPCPACGAETLQCRVRKVHKPHSLRLFSIPRIGSLETAG